MCTLATAVRAWASGRLTRAGVGCDGVNTLVSNAATSPAATITTRAIAATIHHVRRSQPRRTAAGRPPVPTGPVGLGVEDLPGPGLGADRRRRRVAVAAVTLGAMAVEDVPVAAPTAGTPESVSSDTPGARKP